jgi:tRNA uridine 5-carbamoylmethylation protein Kti12
MQVILLRGLPGAGKTTYIQSMKDYNPEVVVCSNDNFLVQDGEYKWTRAACAQAQKHCWNQFQIALHLRKKIVVVDNVNNSLKTLEPYIKAAKEANYSVEIIEIGDRTEEAVFRYAQRNVHGYPIEVIQYIAHNWDNIIYDPRVDTLIRIYQD